MFRAKRRTFLHCGVLLMRRLTWMRSVLPIFRLQQAAMASCTAIFTLSAKTTPPLA